MPCKPPNAFCSIVGQARRQTAGAMGPFTMLRSNLPLGVEGMNVQDRQRRSARQGAVDEAHARDTAEQEVGTRSHSEHRSPLTPSVRSGSVPTVGASWPLSGRPGLRAAREDGMIARFF